MTQTASDRRRPSAARAAALSAALAPARARCSGVLAGRPVVRRRPDPRPRHAADAAAPAAGPRAGAETLPIPEGRPGDPPTRRADRAATSRSAPCATAPSRGLPARLYVPTRRSPPRAGPLLVFFHGGGFMLRRPRSHDAACRFLAERVRRPGAGGRLPARRPSTRSPRRTTTRWRRTAGWSSTPTTLGADPDRLARRRRLRRRQPGRRRRDRGGPRAGCRWRSSCSSTRSPTRAADREPRGCSPTGFYLTKAFMDLGRRELRRRPGADARPAGLPAVRRPARRAWRRRTSSPRASTRCATRARRTPAGWPTRACRWSCAGSPTRSTASSTSSASAARARAANAEIAAQLRAALAPHCRVSTPAPARRPRTSSANAAAPAIRTPGSRSASVDPASGRALGAHGHLAARQHGASRSASGVACGSGTPRRGPAPEPRGLAGEPQATPRRRRRARSPRP